MARSSNYNPEIAGEICSRIADCRSLRSVCKDADMPDKALNNSFLSILILKPGGLDVYASGQNSGSGDLASEIIDNFYWDLDSLRSVRGTFEGDVTTFPDDLTIGFNPRGGL